MHTYYVYILTNKRNGTLYTGVTSQLLQRAYLHKSKIIKGFTEKYDISRLVYYECFNDIYRAIHREKQLKKWKREWKLDLIESINPLWEDLSEDISVRLDPGSSPG
ncbi:MAG: GIY-YIG nuclease family protein [Coxiellaceae bacterium]|nr:GIY-YIG nuclease family protein [Coxiellaceae bacterium]